MSIILKAENISKQYRLGQVGTGTLSHDINRWWHTVRGKEDPYLKVGAVNDRSSMASTDYVWALRDIDFEVKQGEVLGIIGKNGAGKSTLLKILSRVTAPTTGSIKTRGRIASLLEVGTGFHGELTGRENIFMNGAVLGMTKAEIKRKLDEIIAFSGCEMYIDTPTKRYSSGMTVRLGFAVAAHLEPEILVVDEVLAVGDAEFQKKAIGKMQDLSIGQGRTVLFVSHNMGSIQSLCTRGIVLNNGEIGFEGKINSSVDYYLNLNTQGFKNAVYNNKNSNEIIKRIEVLSESKIFITGKSLSFKITLIPYLLNDFEINIGIYNSQDEKILHLSSNDVIGKLINIVEDTLICIIKKNPLLEGYYYANVVLSSNNKGIEKHNKCVAFTVLHGDFFETKILPKIQNVKVLVDQEWLKL